MKILLLYSPSTKGGTKRIMDFLTPEIEVDFQARRPGNMAQYDGVILHNRIDAKPGEPTAIHPCGNPTRRMVEKPEYLERVLAGKPRAIWTFSHTPQAVLSSLPYGDRMLGTHVRIRYMPKPFPLTIPDKCPPMPTELRILWYWRKDWMHTEGIDDQIKRQMKEVADSGVEIWVVSNKRNLEQHAPIKHPNVIPTGRVDIPEMAHKFSGMVRVTEGLDFGRSTYQIMAYGRFCIYVGMSEPCVVNANMDTVAHMARFYAGESDSGLAEIRRKHIADNFSEEVLRKHWLEEVYAVFGK